MKISKIKNASGYALILLLVLNGCVAPNTASLPSKGIFLSKSAQEEFNTAIKRIGHKYWADWVATFRVCEDLKDTDFCPFTHIKPYDSYGPFLVKDIINTSTDGYIFNGVYVIEAPDHSTKYIPVLFGDNRVFNSEDPALKRRQSAAKADAECKRRGGVEIGMTEKEVLASCWGKPRGKNVTDTGRDIHEQWVYGSGYLYFDNGRLKTIQNSY